MVIVDLRYIPGLKSRSVSERSWESSILMIPRPEKCGNVVFRQLDLRCYAVSYSNGRGKERGKMIMTDPQDMPLDAQYLNLLYMPW